MNTSLPWITLALLGAYHGINPAMGWLFAVALGLQERSRAAVARAFAPIALGHAVSVAVVVALVAVAQAVVSTNVIRYAGAAMLICYGSYKLFGRAVHPRWVAMRVGFRDLTLWSFLMSTAHGAGLMLLPVLLPHTPEPIALVGHAGHMQHDRQTADVLMSITGGGSNGASLTAVAIHTLAMFLMMAIVAAVVYEKVGLTILRRAWVNLDSLWAGALIAAGVVSLVLA